MKILVIDIGGTNIKMKVNYQEEIVKIPSGPTLTPLSLIADVVTHTASWEYEAVTIGYPGPVSHGKIIQEPANLGRGWVGYDFAMFNGKPCKLINDAAMQAMGSYEGGRMLFLGLGTGLGSTLIVGNVVCPMELGHLPYRKEKSFEQYVGVAGMKRLGRNKWQTVVFDVVARLKHALQVEYVVLGGGNTKKLDELPPGCRAGDNANAFRGGERLWASENI